MITNLRYADDIILSATSEAELQELVDRLDHISRKYSLLINVILWSHNEETRELPGERDNARNNARCTKAGKATHGLDGQHQDVDRTLCGRVNQNDRGQG